MKKLTESDITTGMFVLGLFLVIMVIIRAYSNVRVLEGSLEVKEPIYAQIVCYDRELTDLVPCPKDVLEKLKNK